MNTGDEAARRRLAGALELRFGDWHGEAPDAFGSEWLAGIAGRRSQRKFRPDAVDNATLDALCALALCAPSKSDLQQRDIVIVDDAGLRGELNAVVADQPWVAGAPCFLVFCGNNRRQRLVHEWRGRPFANDHLDAFFNAAVDAGIALATFVTAAEAIGLGCCPVSGIRNNCERVCELLGLPDHVFPVAGLGVGWPAEDGSISPRLPLGVTVHRNRYGEEKLRETVEAYDRRREGIKPYRTQRFAAEYGKAPDYGWSEDKARQYSKPERADFGQFVRGKGFSLD